MHVLHLTRDFPPPGNGGLSTAVDGIVRAATRHGIEGSVVSFDGYRPRRRAAASGPRVASTGDGVRLLRVDAPSALTTVDAFIDSTGPDVIHVHDAILWDVAASARRRSGTPAVMTVHVAQGVQNRLRGVRRETLSLAAERVALSDAQAIIAPSRALADILVADAPELHRRLHVVGLGIDDSESARSTVATRFDAPTNHEVLYAGRFADINGLAELLAAIPRVVDRVPDATFIVAGGLPESTRAERKWHTRIDAALAPTVRQRVQLTGWLAHDMLTEHYRQAAVLVVPSWFETFGQVALEGMLWGCPIAASRAGGLTDLLEHRRTALLSEPRMVEQLVDDVVSLLEDRQLARRLGSEAACEARKMHRWSVVFPEIEAVYRAVVL